MSMSLTIFNKLTKGVQDRKYYKIKQVRIEKYMTQRLLKIAEVAVVSHNKTFKLTSSKENAEKCYDVSTAKKERYSQGNTNLKIKVTYNIQDLIFESIHSL